jgi:hypothetical protein
MKQGRVLVLRSTSRYIRYELLGDFSVRLLDKLQPLSPLTLRAILNSPTPMETSKPSS